MANSAKEPAAPAGRQWSGHGGRHGRSTKVLVPQTLRRVWPGTMAMLRAVRAHYLERFPDAATAWTVGHLVRLVALVLALPAYRSMRTRGGVPIGELHPVLSSLHGVASGLHTTLHRMMFPPIGERALPVEARMTFSEVVALAARVDSLHALHDVRAGSRTLLEDFVSVMLDGTGGDTLVVLDGEPAAALAQLEEACTYGLHGMRAYSVHSTLRTAQVDDYERLAGALAGTGTGAGQEAIDDLRAAVERAVAVVGNRSRFDAATWRAARDAAGRDMYQRCSEACGDVLPPARIPLARLIALRTDASHEHAARALGTALSHRLDAAGTALAATLHAILFDNLRRAQAVVRAATLVRADIDRILGRGNVAGTLSLTDIREQDGLYGEDAWPVPCLCDALGAWLDVDIVVTSHTIRVEPRRTSAGSPARTAPERRA